MLNESPEYVFGSIQFALLDHVTHGSKNEEGIVIFKDINDPARIAQFLSDSIIQFINKTK